MMHVFGRLAQLVERLPYKQDVTGSSPVLPIDFRDDRKVSGRIMVETGRTLALMVSYT